MFLEDSTIEENEKALFSGTQIFTTGTVYAQNTVIGGKIYYNDGTTRLSGNYVAFDDVFGMINNQRGGVDPIDSENPIPTVLEAASTEKISSNPSTNQKLIGMQETGTPLNYLFIAFLTIIGIFSLKKIYKVANWN